jgi:hypothetical protein
MAKNIKYAAGLFVQIPPTVTVRAARLAALGWLNPPPPGLPRRPTPEKLILHALRVGLAELERRAKI